MNISIGEHGQSERRFFSFIHFLRGVAPLFVMWAHLAFFFAIDRQVNWAGIWYWDKFIAGPLHLYQNGGHLGVIIFFFVSGYIITHTSLKESRTEFAVKRLLRIFPVLAASLLTVYIARYIVGALGMGELTGTKATTWRDFIGAFFLLDMIMQRPQVLIVTWSLVTELLYYGLTLILIRMSKINPERATYAMIAIWLSAELIFAGYGPWGAMRNFSLYVSFLIAGRAIYLADSGILSWRKALPILLLTGILFILLHSYAIPGLLLQPPGEPLASYAIGAVIFLAAMFYNAQKISRIVSFFADISLSLYLLHIPVGMLINSLGLYFGISFTISLIFAITSSVAAAWVSYVIIEKPSQRLARKLVN